MRLASKELAVGSIGYALNYAAHLLRLSTVDGARGGESCEPLTALPICADFVGRVPLDPKEAALGDAPEILLETCAVFQSRDHSHIAEAPCLHDLETIGEEIVRHPEIQVAVIRRNAGDV